MRTAIVTDNIVTNIAVGQVAGGVELTAGEWCAIGAAFDPNGSPRFTKQPTPQTWTALEFLSRFDTVEMDAIETARGSDPIVQSFYRAALAAQEIVSDDPRTVAGVSYLVSVGILTASRRDKILGDA